MTGRRLTLENGDDVGPEVARYVRSLALAGGLTASQTYRLRLATDELVTNIVLHGYHGRIGLVEMEGWVDDCRVWLRIEDEAPPFDPRTHDPIPRLNGGLQHPVEGGFGVYLALGSLDGFRYEHVGGRNRNTLIMLRPRSDAPAAQDGEHDGHECHLDRG
jgi:serine/threonine-protein kinase RsbW